MKCNYTITLIRHNEQAAAKANELILLTQDGEVVRSTGYHSLKWCWRNVTRMAAKWWKWCLRNSEYEPTLTIDMSKGAEMLEQGGAQ